MNVDFARNLVGSNDSRGGLKRGIWVAKVYCEGIEALKHSLQEGGKMQAHNV